MNVFLKYKIIYFTKPQYLSVFFLFLQRTYGKWKELAPSQKCPIMSQNAGKIRSEDYISNIKI